MTLSTAQKIILIAASVAMIAFIAFLPALKSDFVNMDDDFYVYNNHFIPSLDLHLLKSAFLEFQVSNWHPLTWISHSLDYWIWGLNPFGHHLTNNFLHAINTFLVVLLVAKLLEARSKGLRSSNGPDSFSALIRWNSQFITAAVTGMLFGIHPLHVESVAWVSERKDVLCALFFLLSVMAYLRYSHSHQPSAAHHPVRGKGKWYLLSLLCFTLALLSKPMAVTLPAVLLLLDWYPLGRIRQWNTLRPAFIEKVPFFVLSLAISFITVLAQQSAGSVGTLESFPLATRLIVSAKALITYLEKMLIPLNLSPVYAYPDDVHLWALKYLIPVLLATGITAAAIITAKKNRFWAAVWAYYVITLLPVIGIIQVGRQPMADRYTYLSSLGPFLAAGLGIAWLYAKSVVAGNRRNSFFLFLFATVFSVCLISFTIKQTAVWKDSISLWNHVIEKEPEKIPSAYHQRGNVFYEKEEFEKATADFTKAIEIKPDYFKAYNNRGSAYHRMEMHENAIADFNRAIAINPDYGEAYNNRGIIYDEKRLYEEALQDFTMAISVDPDSEKAYNNRGVLFYKLGMKEKAIEDFSRSVEINPRFERAFNNRGVVYDELGRLDPAVSDFEKAVRINPEYSEAYRNLGFSYYRTGKYEMALDSFNKAIALSTDSAELYANRAFAYLKLGEKDLALADLQRGCTSGDKNACTALNDWSNKHN